MGGASCGLGDGGAVLPFRPGRGNSIGEGGCIDDRRHGEGLAVAGEITVYHRDQARQVCRLAEPTKVGLVPLLRRADGYVDRVRTIAESQLIESAPVGACHRVPRHLVLSVHHQPPPAPRVRHARRKLPAATTVCSGLATNVLRLPLVKNHALRLPDVEGSKAKDPWRESPRFGRPAPLPSPARRLRAVRSSDRDGRPGFGRRPRSGPAPAGSRPASGPRPGSSWRRLPCRRW